MSILVPEWNDDCRLPVIASGAKQSSLTRTEQASESFPHSHNVKVLCSLSEDLDKRLIPAWPRETKKGRSRFALLKRAYVEARYLEHYTISAEELDAVTDSARKLRAIVEEVRRQRLGELREGAG